MKKPLKILAIVVGVLLLAVAAGIAYVTASFDAARVKREIETAVTAQTGRTLKIDDLSLGFWPELAVKLGRSTLSERGSAQTFAELASARAAVAVLPLLSKRVEVKSVEVTGLKLALVKRKDGRLNIADLAGGGKEEKVGAGGTATAGPAANMDTATAIALPVLSVGAVRLSDAQLDWRDEATGKQARIVASLALDGIAGNAQALQVDKLALDLGVQADAARIALKLASPFRFDAAQQTLSLPTLSGSLEFAAPTLPAKKVALTGDLAADLTRQNARLNLAAQLDDSHLKARLDVAKFSPPALAFDIDIDRLDLDTYLPAPAQKVGAGKTASDDGKAVEAPLDFAFLNGLDLNGTLRIGALTAAKLKASELKLRLEAKHGRLNIAPLSANLYGGKLDGALALDANGNRVAVKQHLAGVQIAPLLTDLSGTDRIAGRGDVSLDVTSRGATTGALKRSLAGTARLALADGAVKGIDIGAKLREAQSLLAGKRDAGVADDAAQKTDFSELSASFRIAGGVAHNDDLSAKSPLLRLAGAGDIDIGASRLDYLLKASLVATATGQGGKARDEVRGITLPVRLTGPFDHPSWKIELAGLAGEAVKAKQAEIREQAKDKLKGRLKGLLGK